MTKNRYHSFLEENVRGWHAPTVEEERADPKVADVAYDTAVRWLREYARDKEKFPLVLKENISYGFRRNLYGVKPVGIVIALGSVGLNLAGLLGRFGDGNLITGTASLGISFIVGLFLVSVVNSDWVRDAADAYARALLAACDR